MSAPIATDPIDLSAEVAAVELPAIQASTVLLTNQDILLGKPVPAITRLSMMPSGEFEEMILEWATGYLQEYLKFYVQVRQSSGAGDRGRDVVAYIDKSRRIWDNYQCKQYDHVLAPGDIWLELGKLCFYSFKGYFTVPRAYYFVSSKGVGPAVASYLERPDELKRDLIANWEKVCRAGISRKLDIPLSGDLLAYVEAFDFSIIDAVEPLTLIEQYRTTHYYPQRFGGGLLKSRNYPDSPPRLVQVKEARYVEQLFEAYSSHMRLSVKKIEDLRTDLADHFHRQRESFYWADALEQFSRDGSGVGTAAFTRLKDELYFGVVDVCNESYIDGYARLKATTSHAGMLPKSINPLSSVCATQDVHGICHHLANEDRLKWVLK